MEQEEALKEVGGDARESIFELPDEEM